MANLYIDNLARCFVFHRINKPPKVGDSVYLEDGLLYATPGKGRAKVGTVHAILENESGLGYAVCMVNLINPENDILVMYLLNG